MISKTLYEKLIDCSKELDLFFKFLKDFEIDFKIKQALAAFIN